MFSHFCPFCFVPFTNKSLYMWKYWFRAPVPLIPYRHNQFYMQSLETDSRTSILVSHGTFPMLICLVISRYWRDRASWSKFADGKINRTWDWEYSPFDFWASFLTMSVQCVFNTYEISHNGFYCWNISFFFLSTCRVSFQHRFSSANEWFMF